MNFIVKTVVIKDTARPALRKLIAKLTPQRLAATIGPAINNLIKANYDKQGPNKKGWPSRGFWGEAARSTHWEAVADGVLVITDRVGVRQRFLGGDIAAGQGISSKTGQPTKYLAIAARAEAYCMSPAEMNDLVPVFGRKGPVALATGNPKAHAPANIMYWLVERVHQVANARILPTDAEFTAAIDHALTLFMTTRNAQ